jgi:ectoine hydroxylase-related dioxygenase (phytanoyl-CoA dioxygenase family)
MLTITRFVADVYDLELRDMDVDGNEMSISSAVMDLASINRESLGQVYDAIKQIPEFMQLVTLSKNFELFSLIRKNSMAGLAANSYGIRIDLPSEEKYRTLWHQEFPAQLRSLNGLVFWSPLVDITKDLGPVKLLDKSHMQGVLPVYQDNNDGRSGAYSLRLRDENEIVSKFEIVEPCLKVGDLLVMDFNLVHCSGVNKSDSPRFSVQFRLFDFNNDIGKQILWKGSFASGIEFEPILSELGL